MAIVTRLHKNTPIVQPIVHSDFFNNFDIHPNKNDVAKLVNEDSIKNSIKNIIMTRRGERLYNPEFGSEIYNVLFENFSPQTEDELKSLIRTAIENNEPRANVIDIIVTPLLTDSDSAYSVAVYFTTINTLDETLVLEILINRIR